MPGSPSLPQSVASLLRAAFPPPESGYKKSYLGVSGAVQFFMHCHPRSSSLCWEAVAIVILIVQMRKQVLACPR